MDWLPPVISVQNLFSSNQIWFRQIINFCYFDVYIITIYLIQSLVLLGSFICKTISLPAEFLIIMSLLTFSFFGTSHNQFWGNQVESRVRKLKLCNSYNVTIITTSLYDWKHIFFLGNFANFSVILWEQILLELQYKLLLSHILTTEIYSTTSKFLESLQIIKVFISQVSYFLPLALGQLIILRILMTISLKCPRSIVMEKFCLNWGSKQ